MYSAKPNIKLPPLLEVMLAMAVPSKISEIQQTKPEQRITMQDEVPCEWCDAAVLDIVPKQNRYNEGECFVCGGKGTIPRNKRNANLIASHGDAILYKEKGRTAKMFNVLVETLALLSFNPGGVTIGSLHWHSDTEPEKYIKGFGESMNDGEGVRRVRRVAKSD